MGYDENNIFARILRGEIPNKTAYEDDKVLAFHDINPQAPVHVLVIPKGAYESVTDFAEKAGDEEIVSVVRTLGKLAREFGLAENGYRVIANTNVHGGQEVPHLHFHLVGGGPLGPMLPKK